MTDQEKAKEQEVFSQEVSLSSLDLVAGGEVGCGSAAHELWGGDTDPDEENCSNHVRRPIYGGGGFPNCGATVESGSWCARNDACYTRSAVRYQGMESCSKAWR